VYESQMTICVELSVKCLAREMEALGGNLPQFRFVHHKFHMTCLALKPGRQ
jgi:hypothetical protein